jgi:alkyl hydroperoxide reductase subunit AhpC
MSLQLGDTAPDFTAETTEGKINFYEFLGNGWGVLFSHPGDFTPVCTTELGRMASLKDEFAKRNTKIIAVSVDPLDKHLSWRNDINSTQNVSVEYPIIADEDKKVANLYGMLHPNASATSTVRSVFVIDPDKKVRLTLAYPASTGRNFIEILRVIDSLQLTSKHNVATPVDWNYEDDVIISTSISTEDAKTKFPKGVREVNSYIRYTPQPDLS